MILSHGHGITILILAQVVFFTDALSIEIGETLSVSASAELIKLLVHHDFFWFDTFLIILFCGIAIPRTPLPLSSAVTDPTTSLTKYKMSFKRLVSVEI